MGTIDQKQLQSNPFLRARVKAYLNHLSTETPQKLTIHKEKSPDIQVPVQNDKQITFKAITSSTWQQNKQASE